jgi:hypothetical protein
MISSTNTQVFAKTNFVCRPCVLVCLQVGGNGPTVESGSHQ